MALVNYKRKFIYLMEPHTASRATVTTVIKYVPETSPIGNHHANIEDLTYWRRQYVDLKRIKGFDILATVRNPFDVLVTRWRRNSSFKNKPLTEWVEVSERVEDSIACVPSSRKLYKDANIFLYYEELEDDLKWVFTQPELELGYDQSHKTAGKKYWREYYTDGLMDHLLAREDWATYLERFGYHVYKDGVIEIDKDIRVRLTRQF